MVTFYRKIKCPRHYVLKPGGTPFLMERIPSLKNIKESDAKIFGVKLWKRKRDPRTGQFIQNFKDYIQPDVSASFARESIFNPLDPICNKCKRCVTA